MKSSSLNALFSFPGKLVINRQKKLDEQPWEEFIKKVAQTDFWNMVINRDDLGHDGSQWILEGKRGNQYHVVDRWSPNKKTKFYECCNFLLSLTDLLVKNGEKY